MIPGFKLSGNMASFCEACHKRNFSIDKGKNVHNNVINKKYVKNNKRWYGDGSNL